MHCRGCSVENEAGAKFCTECGTKMSLQNSMVVLCDGLDDEGNACTAELFQDYKFCKECGKRVDHRLFERQLEVCKGVREDGQVCGAALTGSSPFCPECGTRKSTERKSDVVAVYPPVINEQADPVASGGIVRVNPVQVTFAGIQRPSDSAGLGEGFVETTNENTVTTEQQSAAVQKAVNIKTVDNSVSPHCPDSPVGSKQHGEGGMVHQQLDLSLRPLTGQGDFVLVPPKESVGAESRDSASQNDLKDSSENVSLADQETGNTENVSSRDQVTDNTENQTSLKTPETTAAPETGENGEFSNPFQKKLLIIDSDQEGESGDTEEMEVEETNVNQNNCGDIGASNVTGVIKQGQLLSQAAGNHEGSPPNKEVSDIDEIHSSDDAVTIQRLDNERTSKVEAAVVSQTTTAGDGRKEETLYKEAEDAHCRDVKMHAATAHGSKTSVGGDSLTESDGDDTELEDRDIEEMEFEKQKDKNNGDQAEEEKEEDDDQYEDVQDDALSDDSGSVTNSTVSSSSVKETYRNRKKPFQPSQSKAKKLKERLKRSIKKVLPNTKEKHEQNAKKRGMKKTKREEVHQSNVKSSGSKPDIDKQSPSKPSTDNTAKAEMKPDVKPDMKPEDQTTANQTGGNGFVFGSGKQSATASTSVDNSERKSRIFEPTKNKHESKGEKSEEQAKEEEDEAMGSSVDPEPNADNNSNPNAGTKKKNKNSQNKETKGPDTATAGIKKDKVPVMFHVLLAEDYEFAPGKHEIYIRFDHEFLGGWKSCQWKMKKERTLENGMTEMVCNVDFPKFLVGLTTKYKYVMYNAEKKKYKYEEYYISFKFVGNSNRTMKIPFSCQEREMWHQYDGVSHPKEGFWSNLVGFPGRTKVLTEDARISTAHFLPAWFHPFHAKSKCPDTTVGDSVEILTYILHGLDQPYYRDGSVWNSEGDFKQAAGGFMLSGVVESMQRIFSENHDDAETRERMFSTALAVLSAIHALKLPKNCLTQTQMSTVLSIILISPDTDNKTFKEQKAQTHFFPDTEKLKDAVMDCVEHVAKTTKDPSWLYAMPLVHFLSGMCKPFDPPTRSLGHCERDPVWWGLTSKLNHCMRSFKKECRTTWAIPLAEVVSTIFPLFEMDYFLPRTFVAALTVVELKDALETKKIPTEVAMATLMYHCRNPYDIHNYSTEEQFHGVSVSLKALLMLLKNEEYPDEMTGDVIIHVWLTFKMAEQLVDAGIETNCYAHIYDTVAIYLHAVAQFTHCESKQNPQQTEHLNSLHDACEKVIGFLGRHQHSLNSDMNKGFEVWNALFLEDPFPNITIKDTWNTKLSDALKKDLETRVYRYSFLMTKLVELYCCQVETFKPCLQIVLGEAAFNSIQNGYIVNTDVFRPDDKRRFSRLLSQMFGDEWKKSVTEDTAYGILNHVMKWPPYVQFVEIFHKEADKDLLSEDCVQQIVQTFSAIETIEGHLVSGTITVGFFRELWEAGSKFPELVGLMCRNDDNNPKLREANVRKELKLRNAELQAYNHQAELITTLTSLCQRFKSGRLTSALDASVNQRRNIKDVTFKQLCKIAPVENPDEYQPLVKAFTLSDKVKDILQSMHLCNSSSVFIKVWDKIGQERGGECQTLEDLVDIMWTPVKEVWDNISTSIVDGTIHFEKFEKHIGNIYTDDYVLMVREMATMEVPEAIANERVIQLQKHRQLETCVRGARVIIQFAKQYELTGNFDSIEQLSHQEGDSEMRIFDDSLIKTCRSLKGINNKRSDCLNMFLKCTELVTWLKKSMEEGLKELKVFVDLAYISAGDTPMEIDRVQVLHSAVTGYAPLIFELDKGAGYKQLLKTCETVWKELDANPNLPKMLKDTARHLEWLENVKKAHGSVEVTSLEQASAINSRGVYCVGYVEKHAEKEDEIMDLSRTLTLTVPKDKAGKSTHHHYNLQKLQDLQSRLMLVAGKAEKGKDDVERFTTIFDSVLRLAKAYLNLSSSGCVLFKHWQAKFLCDRRRNVCAFIDFGQGVRQLKGRTSRLAKIIPMIAIFMERCHKNWLEYIHKKRIDHLHLNFFTIDQLVFLQKELIKIGTDEELSDLLYPLLSVLKENCLPADLGLAMQLAEHDLNEEPMEITSETEANSHMGEDAENQGEADDFVQEIIDAGYSKKVARKALEEFKPSEIDDAVLWCFDHETEIENAESPQDGPAPERDEELHSLAAPYSSWMKSEGTIFSSIVEGLKGAGSDANADQLISDLNRLWDSFLQSVSSSQLTDYMSVEHLGRILKKLAGQTEISIDRPFQRIFHQGEPNLIVCPSADVLNTVLTIYMYPPDGDQPLPGPDEVLLCTYTTTHDQLDIFWRRALFDSQGKIHCLVNADLLDFDVSDRGEATLERYRQELHYNQTEPEYKLVVVCSSDNENRSRIVAALDRYRRPPLPIDCPSLKKFLLKKLRIMEPINGKKSAASLDFEKSSVRLVKSWRAGVGKTLYKHRRETELLELKRVTHQDTETISVPLQEKSLKVSGVARKFLQHTEPPGKAIARIFHIDVAHEVEEGVDYVLFNLLILGSIMDKSGHVWQKSRRDLYLIEAMPLMVKSNDGQGERHLHHIFEVLPSITCRSPQESLHIYRNVKKPQDLREEDQLFDRQEFGSESFQRPYQYLNRLDRNMDLTGVDPRTVIGREPTCLEVLLRHCGVPDPSWSELHHFVWFLNTQLRDFEGSNFTSLAAEEYLPGFAKFTLRFLIQMSRDFSTRSLVMSEESTAVQMVVEEDENDEQDIAQFQMRRTWESSPHPYLFFNPDHHSITFLGFNINKQTGNLQDQQTGQVLEQNIMQRDLYDALVQNQVPIRENFDDLPRSDKITKLCSVLGVDFPYDPDDTYELTTDNVKKILAIYMRFRCNIPVIIMGETGCGKTRLVKFMCSLQAPAGVEVNNMILMKVHGGTTNADIIKKVHRAETVAADNTTKFPHMYTVLFFDEANTTESIGLIKEIMCDRSIDGVPLKLSQNLKMVAACNPYRKHSDELIKKLEQAGLGYHVDADKTTDKLGRVPMRRLVYRVQPLPQSLLPLVWDFGQLNTHVEDLYIRQMVRRYIRDEKLPDTTGLVEAVSAILVASQAYMRQQQDECSFVSLRDVDRVLTVMSWFMDDRLGFRDEDYDSGNSEQEEEEEEEAEQNAPLNDETHSLILALGVCYHACLKTRKEYREHVASFFRAPCAVPGGAEQIDDIIVTCQDALLENVELEKNIAKNTALKENVFMMVVCTELRIPLFLVGKPGSSKSLAKTIVADAMQGNAAHSDMFKNLKQVQMVSFQCSPLSTPDGIVGTFKQCAQFQKDKSLDRFVSVVVLDEVGLAEDSPRMPLKTLHPLLEDGCQGDEEPEKYKKVAFIGISNWALDPAKMNRGILVQREVPDIEELKASAEGICTEENEKLSISSLVQPLAESYLELFKEASESLREFFGLRDFYSLIKMVYMFAEKSKKKPTWHQLVHSIHRNFGGLERVNPIKVFEKHLTAVVNIDQKPLENDPDCSPAGLIKACLFNTNQSDSESRYLLLLTQNYGALPILEQQILAEDKLKAVTVFGSSFPSDQEYTQVCRNINKIKVCMETGNTVVLLNLENLYESLYDALNQYYVYFGGARYVDLGLGSHRVKCRVHRDFRLIVVAEKQVVYKKFPIPLINRLEKHFLTINIMLSDVQKALAKELEQWAKNFVSERVNRSPVPARNAKTNEMKIGDVFMGYHDDTCPAIILHVCESFEHDSGYEVLAESKKILLWCAVPDAVIRLKKSRLSPQEQEQLQDEFFQQQHHNNLCEYLHFSLQERKTFEFLAQVTTHSKLLTAIDKTQLSLATEVSVDGIMIETLQSFDTELQFKTKIRGHFETQMETTKPQLLLVQCDSGDVNANLVACARYCVLEIHSDMTLRKRNIPFHVVFIVQLPRIAGGCFTGFQCGRWHSAHIDDLRATEEDMPNIQDMQNKSIADLISSGVTSDDHKMDDTTGSDEATSEIYRREESAMEVEEGREIPPSISQPSSEEPIHLQDPAGRQVTVSNKGQHKLNVGGLILSCVQSSLAMVKDSKESSKRTTKRVDILLSLLNVHKKTERDMEERSSALFCNGLRHLLASLLKEKENTRGDRVMATQWMPNEAAINTAITKAGTFRRSCTRVIESKISPLLAGAIAFLDTNGNLDILQEGTENGWRTEMWLAFLNSPSALQLHYSDLQSPSREELNEVIIKETGAEGHSFSSGMPFSWLIFEQIEKLKVEYRNTNIEEEEEEEKVESEDVLINLLLNIPQGEILRRVDTEQNREEILNCYLHDFIHLVYNPRSDGEHELVSQSVWYLTHSLLEQRHWTSLLHGLLAIHHAHDKLRARLGYFSDMNRVWPHCSQVILQIKEKNPDHFMFKEEEFTFSVLALLIENLEPKNQKQLDDAKGRLEWLNKVYHCRPVVEKVMQLQVEDSAVFGAHGQRSIHNARCGWTKVVIMKLFLEHVCSVGVKVQHQEKITVKICMTFWKMLGKEANMKEITTLEMVEKFLKMCTKVAQKEYLGKLDVCLVCETPIQGLPIVLPCKHSLCDLCFEELKATTCTDCPNCNKNFPRDFNPNTIAHERLEVQRFVDYQKRCNSFFMDAVSQLCFAHNEPPSDIVVEKLFSYITLKQNNSQTIKTKDLTIFSSGLDPNPVFRSFLLQLLLRTSEEKVEENLNKYFDTARVILQQGNPDVQEDLIQLCLLVIQCLEDKLCKEAIKDNEIKIAIGYLRQARYGLKGEMIEKLHSLAKSRIGLAITAKYINSIMEQSQTTVCAEVRRLIKEAEKLCDDEFCKWPRIYMVKYLCRYYGQNSYHALCTTKIPYLKWIRLRNIQQKVECADRYIVCGEQYRQIREAVTRVTIGEDFRLLDDLIGELRGRGQFKELHLRLALHKEVTCSHLYPAKERNINPENMVRVREKMLNSGFTQNKTVLHALLDNQIGGQCDLLQVRPGLDLHNQGLQCLLVHCFAVFVDMDADQTLLSPIKAMITKPQELQNSFLPSMPQDETAEVKQALLAFRQTQAGANENPVFYRCPNGHPYVIGDCGRPAFVGNCPKCGQQIGGHGHNLLPGNSLDNNVDRTETGHILGRAEQHGDGPLLVRSLTASSSVCVRLVTHIAMILGALSNEQAVTELIKPALAIGQVYRFLRGHIDHDIREIQRVIGISFDDVLLMMHLLLNAIANKARVPIADSAVCRWTSQPGRRQWEEKFVAAYISPILQKAESEIAKANRLLLADKRLGADPLLCLLYETDKHDHRTSVNDLQELPSVWRYRNQISLAHLQNAFASKMSNERNRKQYGILQLFLNEEHILRAMLYVPSVLKLQRKLIQKYQRKMDRAEASTITVSQLKRDPELRRLIGNFATCWELVREYLKVYDCPTELGRMFVSKEYCSKPVDNDTPVSMLLPTTRDAGLCSYAMLDFLFRKQNDILYQFWQASRSDARKLREEMSKVKVDELTPAHLICFHRDQDLLSMVFANCQYSFEVGSGTKIQYDFDSLERQIMDRFLYSKSRIDIQGFLKIQLMEYRAEYTNAVVFKKLEEKIPQESVGNAVKRQVCDDNKNLPDLCRSIDNLDITISFLKSIGGNPEENLDHFMRETLKMNTPLHSQKARQYCQFKHARALWVLMSLMKARKMAEHQQGRQAVFDHLHEEYRELITEEVEEKLEVYLQGLTVERLDNLLEVMYECIVLVISIPQNPDDEDYSDNKNMSLRDLVMVHAEAMEPSVLDTQILSDFPVDVKCRHCSSAWVLVFDVLYQKRTGQRP